MEHLQIKAFKEICYSLLAKFSI